MSFVILVALISLPTQVEPTQDKFEDLIRKLGDPVVEERETAAQRLKDAGKAALPGLQKATRSTDREIAMRAQSIIQVIEVRERISPRLLKAFPGVDERLAVGGPPAWTRAFLKAIDLSIEFRNPNRPLDGDLDTLVAEAIRGAKHENGAIDRCLIGEVIDGINFGFYCRRLPSAIPGLLELLQCEEKEIRWKAAQALADLGARHVTTEVAELLAWISTEA